MKTTPRSRLLLLELLLDLVIFVVCAAVCVALLTRAHLMSRESRELTQGVYLAQDYAEGGVGDVPDGYAVTGDGGVITVTKDGRTVYTLETGVE